MPKAIWNGAVIAASDRFETVEGSIFQPDALDRQYFKESATHSICPWKGTASDLTAAVDGAGYGTFWRGVDVKA